MSEQKAGFLLQPPEWRHAVLMGELWKRRVTFTPTANVGWGGTWTGLIRAVVWRPQGVEEGRRFDPATSVVGIVGVIDEAAPDSPALPIRSGPEAPDRTERDRIDEAHCRLRVTDVPFGARIGSMEPQRGDSWTCPCYASGSRIAGQPIGGHMS